MLDRIQYTVTTTGTGAYSLSTPDAGYQSLFAAWDNYYGGGPITVPYIVTDGTDWEIGYGQYDGADPGTIARTFVENSSNAGAEVDWGAGDKTLTVGPLSNTGQFPAARYDTGGSDPDTDSDALSGFAFGSFFFSFGSLNFGDGGLFFCLDSTPTLAEWTKFFVSTEASVVDSTIYMGAASRARQDSFNVTANAAPGAAVNTFCRNARVLKVAHTSSSTADPVDLKLPDGAGIIKGTIVALHDNNSYGSLAVATWDVSIVFRTSNSTGEPEIVGTPTITSVESDAALSSVGVSVAAYATGPSDRGVRFTQTSVPADALSWSFDFSVNEIAILGLTGGA